MSKLALASETISAAHSPDDGLTWRERRDWFRSRLQQSPVAGLSPDEVEVHFNLMPAHYWERVTEADLIWGLETIHGFFKLVASPHTPPTAPFVDWRSLAPSPGARVLLCTWNRHGLLAKCAAAFSAVRLNIRRAEVYTRADNVVLDSFQLAEVTGAVPVNAVQLQEMSFVLEGALSEPPRFASVWACSRHKYLAQPGTTAPQISFDNDSAPGHTLIRLEAPDRLGLLYDLLQALADAGLEIAQADIETEANLARDVLHVTDALGQKVLAPDRLAEIRAGIHAALTVTG